MKVPEQVKGNAGLKAEREAAFVRYMNAITNLLVAQPESTSELLQKVEAYALHHPDDDLAPGDLLDWMARDLPGLGASHKLSDKSARTYRNRNVFADSNMDDEERASAVWRYVEGRGLLAVVPQ